MMSRIFPYLYGLFILSEFLIGQIKIPGSPLNILQITTIVMFSVCFVIDKKLLSNKYLVMYFIFLFFYFISATITGFTDDFFKLCFSSLLISYTVYWATKILVTNYSTLLPLIVPAVIAGVSDSIATITQALGIPINSPLFVLLMQNTEATNVVVNTGDVLGTAVCGFFLNPVLNGHALLFFYLCSLFAIRKVWYVAGIACATIILVGLFFCQQRSAFYLAVIITYFLFYKVMQSSVKTKFIVFFVSIVSFSYLLPLIEEYTLSTGSRIMHTDSSNRDVIWSQCIDFISENLMIGGYELFWTRSGYYPHNLILSSLLAGGLLGGGVAIWLVFSMVINSIKSFKYYDKSNPSLLISGCMLWVILADSFTHNTGIVEADFATLLSMSLCYYYNIQSPYKYSSNIYQEEKSSSM